MRFDWTIRPYDIIVFSSAMAVSIKAWIDMNWRMKNLESWKDAHFHTTEQALANITMLREAVIKLTAVADATEKRLTFVEDRVDWHRGKAQ